MSTFQRLDYEAPGDRFVAWIAIGGWAKAASLRTVVDGGWRRLLRRSLVVRREPESDGNRLKPGLRRQLAGDDYVDAMLFRYRHMVQDPPSRAIPTAGKKP